MAKLPKIYYALMVVVLIIVLAGCELRRDDGDASSPRPVSELPTLVPLGAENAEIVAEASPIPTVINVQPTATQPAPAEGEVAPDPQEPPVPTSEPVSIEPQTSAAGESQPIESEITEDAPVEPETFTPPAAEAAAVESVVVDAPTEELPDGGPIAADPPASQTTGDYIAAPVDGSTHVVQPGDTLFSIGQRYGTSAEAILRANGLTSDLIYVGQELVIVGDDGSLYPTEPYNPVVPVPSGEGGYHVVAPGETLFRIALTYNTSVDAVAGANGIPYPYIIHAGEELVIPAPGVYPGPPPPPADDFFQPDPGYIPPADPGFIPPAQQPGFGPPDNSFAPQGPAAGTHTVGPGETLFSISQIYGYSAQAIAEANGLRDPNQIYVGQVLYLP